MNSGCACVHCMLVTVSEPKAHKLTLFIFVFFFCPPVTVEFQVCLATKFFLFDNLLCV